MAKFSSGSQKLKKALALGTRGVSALEFAFAAPVIITLILGSIEVGYQGVIKSVMESAVTGAAREAITGRIVIPGKTRDEVILMRIRDAVKDFSLIKIVTVNGNPAQGNPRIKVNFYSSQNNGGGFSKVREPEPLDDFDGDGGCDTGNVVDQFSGLTVKEKFNDANGNNKWDSGSSFSGAGGPGDIVSYDVEVDSPLLFGIYLSMGNKATTNGGDKDMMTMRSQLVVQNETYAVAATNGNIKKYCDGTKV
jgi:TadE-like protein